MSQTDGLSRRRHRRIRLYSREAGAGQRCEKSGLRGCGSGSGWAKRRREKEKSKRVAALCIRPDLGERSTE